MSKIKNQFLMFLFLFFFSFAHSYARDAKKKITFIVNPISHEIKGRDIQRIIQNNLDSTQFEYKIVYTKYAEHATELASDALQEGADIIAAVGGDGTVNEVGRALIDTNGTLAIIPVGSGNGLARHLGVPIGLTQAIKALNYSRPVDIDTAKINDKTFLGVAGIGFDAQIAWQFAKFGKRGFFSYCHAALKEFSKYVPQSYLLTIDGKKMVRKAFILTFANSSQYGNNFIIAPEARVHDGFLDLVIIDRIPGYDILNFLYKFKHGAFDHSRHFETYRFKELTIEQPYLQAHIDGEPIQFLEPIRISIQPDSLKIMVPRKFDSRNC